MQPGKLLLVHHFPLTSVTGVTVMVAEVLRLMPEINPTIVAAYQHYGDSTDPATLERTLEALHADAKCVVGINIQIEVQWDFSLALARWCKRRSIPLFNYVQDYWPHHESNMHTLTEEFGVRLLAASPSLVDSLAAHGFKAVHVPSGVQLCATEVKQKTDSLKLIGAVGRLIRRKRFPDTVRAFCEGRLDKISRLRLTVVRSHSFASEQDAEQMRLIETELARSGADRSSVEIVTTPTVPPDYSSLSIYVSASDYEGFSLTPYEAAYAGCVPIVSDIPPHRYMATALFGKEADLFMFPVTNVAALSATLRDELTTGRRREILQQRLPDIRRFIETYHSFRATAAGLAEICERG